MRTVTIVQKIDPFGLSQFSLTVANKYASSVYLKWFPW